MCHFYYDGGAQRGQQHANYIWQWQNIRRENKWWGQPVQVNYNHLAFTLIAKPKSLVFLLFPINSYKCGGTPHRSVGCYDCVTYCDIPMDLQTKQLLSQHVSSETEAITNSKQNAWLGLGRERKSLGFKQKFGPNPKVTVSFWNYRGLHTFRKIDLSKRRRKLLLTPSLPLYVQCHRQITSTLIRKTGLAIAVRHMALPTELQYLLTDKPNWPQENQPPLQSTSITPS